MAKDRIALITGISGQDGAYLARALLDDGYAVHGTSRSLTTENVARLSSLGVVDRVRLHSLDLLDPAEIASCLAAARFTHIFHLSAQSSVSASYKSPAETIRSITISTANLAGGVASLLPDATFVNASSSEIFGTSDFPMDEGTPFLPRSPYGIAKASAHWLVADWRRRGHRFSSVIMFNHESPLRSRQYVTMKIVTGAVDIYRRQSDSLVLGNLEVVRDWGWAPEYVEAMKRIADEDTAEDYVVATGQPFSLRDFMASAFGCLGLKWQDHVSTSPEFMRQADISRSVGNPAKINRNLGWKAMCAGRGVVERLVAAELERNQAKTD
jgi:GDPmannose 4,6-dehydratase